MRHFHSNGVVGALALSAAAIAAPALAGPVFLGGTATITHASNFGGSPPSATTGAFTIPAYSSTVYQYQTTSSTALTNGTATSTARAGIGYVAGANNLGLSFAGGTNLTQRGNSNPDPLTASTLRIDFDATFRIDGTPFTNTTAGASFGLLGNLPTGGTAFTDFVVSATFYYAAPASEPLSMRVPIAPTPFFSRTAAGSFTFSGSDIRPSTPSTLVVGSTVQITGFIQFRVHNDMDEALLEIDNRNREGTIAVSSSLVPTPGAAIAGFASLAGLGLLSTRRRRI